MHKIQADVADFDTLQDLPQKPRYSGVLRGLARIHQRQLPRLLLPWHQKHILKALKGGNLKRAILFPVSVYHQMDGSWVDETSPTEPTSFGGKELLAAENALLSSNVPGTVVRFTGIYGPDRTRMINQSARRRLLRPWSHPFGPTASTATTASACWKFWSTKP